MALAALRLLPAAAGPVETSTAAGSAAEGDALAFPLRELVVPGRLVELSSPSPGVGARTSTAVSLLRRAQREGETTAWIQPQGGLLYPPDLHDAGLDLEALVVVHVPLAEGAAGIGKAAELLLRSGAFGLVVVDLGALEAGARTASRTSWQGRLLGLARQHEARVLLLTDKPAHADSLGPLVGLRVEPRRHREPNGTFAVEPHVLKNKSGAPVAPAVDRFVGPAGLR